MIEIWFGAVLSILTTLAVAIAVEYLRKPELKIELLDPPGLHEFPVDGDQPVREMRYVTVAATHRPIPRFARLMGRNPALSRHGHISFHRMDGSGIFPAPMPLRWAGSQQPLMPKVVLGGVEGRIIDEDGLFMESTADIAPSERRTIDLAARLDDDEDCYGWCNGSYLAPGWRSPWKLPQGRYLVRVTVFSGGESWSEVFKLLNQGPRDAFRLEEACRATGESCKCGRRCPIHNSAAADLSYRRSIASISESNSSPH